MRFSLPSIIITITSNEPWNTETHKTDRNPPITNQKPWPFEPVKVKFCVLRGPLRWLTAAKNAIVSWLLNFRIRMFVKSAVIDEPRARSIQPKFQLVRPGKVVHLKRWTRFFETFPVGPNRSIEFWTEISGKFGWMDRAHFFQLDREFFCLLPSLTRLYSAAASPSERLRSDGSLAIIANPACWEAH